MDPVCEVWWFSDDSPLVGTYLINRRQIAVKWCDENGFTLNLSKAKELIIDFREKKTAVTPVVIKNVTAQLSTEGCKQAGLEREHQCRVQTVFVLVF